MVEAKEQFTAEITASSGGDIKKGILRGKHTVYSDEPTWSAMPGNDDHPSPVDYLLLSLASCQLSVLDQCLEKNGVDDYQIKCNAYIDNWEVNSNIPDEMPATTGLRVEHVIVEMNLTTTPEHKDQAERCLTVYDEGCVVGKSIGLNYTPLTSLVIEEGPIEAN